MDIFVPDYVNKSFKFVWEQNSAIKCTVNNSAVVIEANKDGLVSLARHMLELAQEAVPNGAHFHLDEFNAFEDGSSEMIIVKKEI